METTQSEAIKEIHARVRQCFTRHQFKTFGDALHWLHQADFETQQLEAGEQGMSKFSRDILWLISTLGPKETVDYKVMATRKVPDLKPVTVDDPDEPEITDSSLEIPQPKNKCKISKGKRKTSKPKRKSRRKRF